MVLLNPRRVYVGKTLDFLYDEYAVPFPALSIMKNSSCLLSHHLAFVLVMARKRSTIILPIAL